ncbi:hypothetical protein O988_07801 [Pseudogymnoascus sp. VKM F-3808]|nr:hypothetical protein O988_07801 [Pseudogymnoascus sp. VKM F-3808]
MDDISKIVAADRYHHSLAPGTSTHLVQFYDEEEYLYHVLLDFFAPLLANVKSSVGAIKVCVNGAIDNKKRSRKVDGGWFGTSFGAVYRKGRRTVLLVDADEILTRIVPKNELNAEEFSNTIINLLSQIHLGESTGLLRQGDEASQPIYAYGELVDMLCARGQHLLALELETLWNRLLSFYNIALLCGYKMDSFRGSQQLHWSDGVAEQRARHREQFIDMLCHELRNPVSGIIGNVELLQIGLEVRQGIIRSHQEGYRNGEFRLSATDVASLQNQLADDFVSVDAIALIANLPSEDLHILGDRGRVAQVLVNLISNAIKFTDIGNVIVELSYLGPTLLGSCESLFKVAVRDTGCGLDKSEISLLFQRFAQPVSTSFARHGGTGLGLYISKQLVELMGGSLYVESQKGKGSVFFFTFQAESCVVPRHSLRQSGPAPLSTASSIHSSKKDQGGGVEFDKAECSPRSSSHSLSNSTTSIGTTISTGLYDLGVKHILVVDDNPIIVRTLTHTLESASISPISVSTASNGYDAINKLIERSTSSLPIDLILMDLEMPFLNGLNTTREIRQLRHPDREECQSIAQRREAERLSATLIIGLTGDARESRFMEARDSGLDDCAGKPVVKKTLCELIYALSTKGWRDDDTDGHEGIGLNLERLAPFEVTADPLRPGTG